MRAREVLNRQTAPVLAAGAACPLLLLLRPDFVEPFAAVLFILTMWLGLLPCVIYLLERKQSPVPFLPLIGLFYIVFFALPPFLVKREWWSTGGPATDAYGITFERITTFTAALVFLGLAATIGMFYLCRDRWFGRLPRLTLPENYSRPKFRMILWALATAHVMFLYVPWLRSITPLAQAAAPVGFMTLGMLFVFLLRGEMRELEKVAYWGLLLPLEMFIHFYEGLITPIILNFVFLLTLYWHVKRKLGVILVLGVLAAFYVFPVLKLSNAFVAEPATAAAERIAGKIEALGLASLLLSRNAERQEEEDALIHAIANKNVMPPILRRIALVVLLQYCVDWTPSRIPYIQGETLRNLVTNLVPRFLWRDKPPEVMGQWFGHHYRILLPTDQVTSMNLPWLVEFYINFGALGVIVGMAIVGAFIALLDRMFLSAESTDVETVTGWAVVFRLFYQESNLSLMVGGFFTQALFLVTLVYVLLRLLRTARLSAPS